MDIGTPTLRGRHVTLEPLREDHADALLAAITPGDDVFRWTSAAPATRDEMSAWIRARVAGRRGLPAMAFAQRDAPSGRPIGSTSLFDIDLAEHCAEIGHTWLGAPWRRTGANTEAKLLLLDHAFGALRLQRVQLVTDARNERSQRAIARIGATREGVLRNHRRDKEGKLRDSVYSSIVADEWPRVREHLSGMLREP